MIEIQIAGAGAGKTYNLSEKIIQFHEENISHKLIYAITYTNAAKKKISDEIIKRLGYIPDKVRIETVHGFFLNEVIYPYSQYTISEVYNNAVSYTLPTVHAYKNKKLSLLKKKRIIHSESVFNKAKIIIDRSNSKHGNKAKKTKVDFVNSHIAAKISHIFIDEAQDLDGDALCVFKILGENAIDVYMIGDPKQAIKFPGAFRDFIKQATGKDCSVLSNNNFTKRVPANILKLSNELCLIEEKQINSNGKAGTVSYIKSSNRNYNSIIDHYKSLGHLIYIEEKQGCYDTHSSRNLFLPLSLEEKLFDIADSRDLDRRLFIASIISEINERLKNSSSKQIITWLSKHSDLRLEREEYAELIQHLEKVLACGEGIQHVVSSIEAVKGLESEVCVFILNQTMYDYVTQNIPKTKHHNKNWNKAYVALTRSCDTLILALDSELFSRNTILEVENYLKKMDIYEIPSREQLMNK
jgi:superfamily I DNA/RNA helicase